MPYLSTRGAGDQKTVPFSDVLLGGLADDGGLYLPTRYPRIDEHILRLWSSATYPALALRISGMFTDDMPHDDLSDIIGTTYVTDRFGTDDITPVKKVSKTLYLLQLSNGPTLAFKDVAMQLLLALFEYELKRRGQKMNILGATSGDTGSAAIYAALKRELISVFMLSPFQSMSRFQTAQMYSVIDPRIFNISVKHSLAFDYCQMLVKEVMRDLAFKQEFSIGAVNSINWARIMAQIVYYFYGYFQLKKDGAVGEPVDFVVPTGNFGDICAGHIARMMGLPIRHLVLATNENNILHNFVQTGKYHISPRVLKTLSPSMDIGSSSNFERFMWDVLLRDGARIKELFSNPKGFSIEGDEFTRVKRDYGFLSGECSDAECIATIARVWNDYGVMIDTHTATAAKVALELMRDDPADTTPRIVLETAQPAKFEDAIHGAIGFTPHRPRSLADLENRPQKFKFMDGPGVDDLKNYIREHALN